MEKKSCLLYHRQHCLWLESTGTNICQCLRECSGANVSIWRRQARTWHPTKAKETFPSAFHCRLQLPTSALNRHSVLCERLLVQLMLEAYVKQLRSVTLLTCFWGSCCFYEWSELHIRNVEIRALGKMPSEKPHRSYLELQGYILGVQKHTERKEGIPGPGKVNNWMEFAHALCCWKLEYRFHHSLFATHCCHHVLPRVSFPEIITSPEREACGGEGPENW